MIIMMTIRMMLYTNVHLLNTVMSPIEPRTLHYYRNRKLASFLNLRLSIYLYEDLYFNA